MKEIRGQIDTLNGHIHYSSYSTVNRSIAVEGYILNRYF